MLSHFSTGVVCFHRWVATVEKANRKSNPGWWNSLKKYLLLIICNLTKYVHLYPVKTANAEDTVECFKKLILTRL